jgi:hypothetical protein
MRILWLRCLVVLLALALAGGNARAELHLGDPSHDPCPETLGRAQGGASHHRHDRDNRAGCCCDCLGCVSAINLIPDLGNTGPMFYGAMIRFADVASFLPGRAFPPELGPPRPGTLR